MYLSGTSEVLGLISPGAGADAGRDRLSRMARPHAAGRADPGRRRLARLARGAPRPPARRARRPRRRRGRGRRARSSCRTSRASARRSGTPAARGAFAGLTTRSDPAALTLAVMEGVAFSARLALRGAGGLGRRCAPPLLQAGGGGMQSDRWCRIRADALGRPLRRMARPPRRAPSAPRSAPASAAARWPRSPRPPPRWCARTRLSTRTRRAALADERFATCAATSTRQLRPINARLASSSLPAAFSVRHSA